MAQSEKTYKLTLKSEGINIDRNIEEGVARQIILLVMGGDSYAPAVSNPQLGGGLPLRPGAAGFNSSDPSITAKAFMAEKKPASEVERIACLAYYLTHYKETTSFKTLDLTKLNTEAAQRKLSNAAFAARNAVTQEYLSLAGGGRKQITVRGEALVDALPDREKVKQALSAVAAPKRRKQNRPTAKKASPKGVK